MKIGFIQAYEPQDRNIRDDPPLGFAFLASYLEKSFNDIEFFYNDDVNELIKEKPDLVGISSYTPYFGNAIQIAKTIKQTLNVPVILGGCHITSLPHFLPECFDVAVIGEGEITFLEIVKLAYNSELKPDILSQIKGIVFKKNNHVIKTAEREFIKPLDEIPLPKRGILKWSPTNHYLHTSRGCPFRCRFCNPVIYWKGFRGFSPEYVLEDLRQIFAHYQDVKRVTIHDDLFVANKKRFARIAELVLEEGFHKRTEFACAAKSSYVDHQICHYLQQMNVSHVSLGLESGSQRILTYLKRGTATVEDNQRAVDLLYEYGIKVCGAFIIFSPDEEWTDLYQTFEFIIRNWEKLIPSVVFLMPLPGTEIWDYAKKRGLVREDAEMNWSIVNQKININSKIGKYEFYRFYQECKKLSQKTPIPEAKDYLERATELIYEFLAANKVL